MKESYDCDCGICSICNGIRKPGDPNPKTLGDYDRWYKPCSNCGYDPGRSDSNRCWKCGRKVYRDYSERALKK